MAALTGTQFIAKALLLGGNAVEDISNDTDQALVWISQAIVNRHSEVCELMNKWAATTKTVNSDRYTLDIPDDWDGIGDFQLYYDENQQREIDDFEVKDGVIRFYSMEPAGRTIYMRYRLAPNDYTAVGTSIVETANPRLLSILLHEFISLFLATDNDLEDSNAGGAEEARANNNS